MMQQMLLMLQQTQQPPIAASYQPNPYQPPTMQPYSYEIQETIMKPAPPKSISPPAYKPCTLNEYKQTA